MFILIAARSKSSSLNSERTRLTHLLDFTALVGICLCPRNWAELSKRLSSGSTTRGWSTGTAGWSTGLVRSTRPSLTLRWAHPATDYIMGRAGGGAGEALAWSNLVHNLDFFDERTHSRRRNAYKKCTNILSWQWQGALSLNGHTVQSNIVMNLWTELNWHLLVYHTLHGLIKEKHSGGKQRHVEVQSYLE